VCCSVLQCVAVCCSVLQCVAVCCSVLQHVAVRLPAKDTRYNDNNDFREFRLNIITDNHEAFENVHTILYDDV